MGGSSAGVKRSSSFKCAGYSIQAAVTLNSACVCILPGATPKDVVSKARRNGKQGDGAPSSSGWVQTALRGKEKEQNWMAEKLDMHTVLVC